MAVRLQFIPRHDPPDLIGLPWGTALADWDHPRLVRMAAGASRHVVRFLVDAAVVLLVRIHVETWADGARPPSCSTSCWSTGTTCRRSRAGNIWLQTVAQPS